MHEISSEDSRSSLLLLPVLVEFDDVFHFVTRDSFTSRTLRLSVEESVEDQDEICEGKQSQEKGRDDFEKERESGREERTSDGDHDSSS